MTSIGFHFGILTSNAGQRSQDLQQLAQQREPDVSSINSERNRGLIGFTGRSVVITPAELLFDPNLNDSDRIYWCALRLMCQEGSNNVSIMPDQHELAERLGKTRYMIIVYNKMLRATRWITQVEALRQNNIPTRYSYAIHEHPMDLDEVLLIDSEYKDFIQKEAYREKNTPRLSQYCQRVLKQLGIKDATIIIPNQKDTFPAVEYIQQREIYENSSAVEFIQQREIDENSSAVEFIQQREIDENSPAVEFIQQAENPAVEFIQQREDISPEEGYIYNRAHDAHAVISHAHAPTQRRIIKIKDFNNTHPSIQGRGYGGREGVDGLEAQEPKSNNEQSSPKSESPFAWLYEPPFSHLLPKLEEKFGRKGAHSLLNRIKLGEYSFRNQSFRYRADPDDAAVILVSLLDREVKSPLSFIDGLLWRATNGELIWQDGQLHHWRQLTGEQTKSTKPTTPVAETLPDGTWLEGNSGTRYYIDSGTIWSEATWQALQDGAASRGEPIPNNTDKRDGLNTIGINLIRDHMHLIASGKLRIFNGEET